MRNRGIPMITPLIKTTAPSALMSDESSMTMSVITMKFKKGVIRGQFYNAAEELEEYGRVYVQDNVVTPLDDSIHGINENIRAIRSGKETKSALCKEVYDLQDECNELIREIHTKSIAETS